MERLDSTATQHPEWAGWMLIQPCVSVGHVGQLAVDLLVSSLRAQRVGSFYHPSLYPVAGAGAPEGGTQDSVTLNSALELYVCQSAQLVVLQQRSPCIPGTKSEFCNSLSEWIKRHQFRHVIVLSSLDSQIRQDVQLYGDQLRYVCNKQAEELLMTDSGKSPKSLQWQLLEEPTGPVPESARMLGSGLAQRLLVLLTEHDIPVTIVLPFSQAGAQSIEAEQVLVRLNQWLCVLPAGK